MNGTDSARMEQIAGRVAMFGDGRAQLDKQSFKQLKSEVEEFLAHSALGPGVVDKEHNGAQVQERRYAKLASLLDQAGKEVLASLRGDYRAFKKKMETTRDLFTLRTQANATDRTTMLADGTPRRHAADHGTQEARPLETHKAQALDVGTAYALVNALSLALTTQDLDKARKTLAQLTPWCGGDLSSLPPDAKARFDELGLKDRLRNQGLTPSAAQ